MSNGIFDYLGFSTDLWDCPLYQFQAPLRSEPAGAGGVRQPVRVEAVLRLV